MQSLVVPLWSLLEACRAGSGTEQQQAAAALARAVSDHCESRDDARSGEPDYATVELVDERLVIDGFPVVSGIDTFAATQGLMAILYEANVQQVQFATDVAAASLQAWGNQVARKDEVTADRDGVHSRLRQESESSEVVRPQSPPRPSVDDSDSRLRSVFLQHRLIAGLPAIEGVDATIAKLVIEGVVDRLLQVRGGLEPLMLLQQDEALLKRSTAVAVLAVVFARHIGWPVELLADLGAAGLLHDVGEMLDPAAPGPAAFQWLLERGDEDFWLRSALVARRWRDGTAASTDQAGPLSIIAVVRMAAAAYQHGGAGLDVLLANGAAPVEMVELARAAISA